LGTFARTESQVKAAGVLDLPRVEMAVESAYLLGVFGNPNSYEMARSFYRTSRWGTMKDRQLVPRLQSILCQRMAEPIFRGVENHYFGTPTSVRAITSFDQDSIRAVHFRRAWAWLARQPSGRSGRTSAGFHFNILSAAGISYKMNDQLEAGRGNPLPASLQWRAKPIRSEFDLLGPKLVWTYSFWMVRLRRGLRSISLDEAVTFPSVRT